MFTGQLYLNKNMAKLMQAAQIGLLCHWSNFRFLYMAAGSSPHEFQRL